MNIKLIEAVQGHPNLYDLANETYHDKNARVNSWREIASELLALDPTKDESHNTPSLSKALQAKWKGLRSSYARARRENKGRIGQAAQTKRVYKYAHKLGFLDLISKKTNTLNTPNVTQNESTEHVASCSGTSSKKRKTDEDPATLAILNYLEKKQENEVDELDLFFQQMAVTVRKLPPRKVVDVKRAIFNLVVDAEEASLEP
ncbi:uncharacterized protein LOC131682993 [Topomyia yanbarensis]|uniref:uncharacterized protein LOC131682993 n=1 Tax=Topomyia yanbarensis TaxID=2498891 RepID=UPI00273CA10D|nr:uncharacterized protein LOC131682993 [Topomyia yanbarensis]